MKLNEIIEFSNRDVILSILKMREEDDRIKIIEGITKMDTLPKEKWNFITSIRKLLNRDLSREDIASMMSECNKFKKGLEEKIKKLQKEYEEIGV